jgi:hypothetical protein
MNSSVNSENQKTEGIKRRSFLGYMGLSAIGLFLFSKLPGKLFKSGITGVNRAIPKKNSIKVTEAPQSVKRQMKQGNGTGKNIA